MTTFHPLGIDAPGQHLQCRFATDCDGAQIYIYARGVATVVRIDGEIDASNAERVTAEIRRFSRPQIPLILDLSHVDFLGIEGFRSLLLLNEERQKARLHCSVVPGPAARILLRIVKGHGLPLVGSVPEALQLIEDTIGIRRRAVPRLTQQREYKREAIR